MNPVHLDIFFSLLLIFSTDLHTIVCKSQVVTEPFADDQHDFAPAAEAATYVDVGLILDLDSERGKMIRTCVSMAVEDFYAAHRNYSTRIRVHTRDSKNGIVEAASAATDLLKNTQVKAIFGPLRSAQADFVADFANKSRVPLVSFTEKSPFLSPIRIPYFVRIAQNDAFQVKAITAIVKAYGWIEVVPIYQDDSRGNGIVSYLSDALQSAGVQIPHRCTVSPSAQDDQLRKELYKLMTMQTRVFVVYTIPSLAFRLFSMAKEVGMMEKGYAWIVTDGIASMLSYAKHPSVLPAMEGVVGLKTFIPKSKALDDFSERWKQRFLQENPSLNGVKLNAFGLWAYDSIFAVALAVEETGDFPEPGFRNLSDVEERFLTDLTSVGVSEIGPKLLESILNTTFNGLSGDFKLVKGELQSSTYQIVNVVDEDTKHIGFWNPVHGISKEPNPSNSAKTGYGTSKENLAPVVWPGRSIEVPKGWEIPTSERKLRIGVPLKEGFEEFIKVERDAHTNKPIVTGFCVDVFKAVVELLPYAVPYEFVPFETYEGSGRSAGNYSQLVYAVHDRTFDAVVGDITIVESRLEYADFTLPYTESGVALIVPVRDDERKNAWIFMKPLSTSLWLTIAAFFLFTGFVVWVLEHRVNSEFRGPPNKQVGMIFWFSFSTLVFAHREKVISNLSRFVLIVWMFVVMVLTSSYTASLTSLLTVKQLEPTRTDIDDIVKIGEVVGYPNDSFIGDVLKNMKIDGHKQAEHQNFKDYDEALSQGRLAAIMDELPYIRRFLAKYCGKYAIVGPIFRTAGFGFAFPKGSRLVADVSKAILNVTEGNRMKEIERTWFGDDDHCSDGGASSTVNAKSLTLDCFKGLFIIAAASSTLALTIFIFIFLYENRSILSSKDSMQRKLTAMVNSFDQKKANPSCATTTSEASSDFEMTPTAAALNDVIMSTP